ncbi:MAG: polysaccharide biosynthesis/export family protein [Opitutaceae bacterium]|nr:polysaccharide biosynthesis/export family protein [Opitutaceae bacterium]
MKNAGLSHSLSRGLSATAALLLGLAVLLGGCETAPAPTPTTQVKPGVQILNPGDVIKVSFPGSTTLDMTQQIRRDGMLNLYLVGEVKAVDKTPAQLEKDLVALYASQITSKEVKVTVVSSAFSVFVTGAVMKPGKVTSERELTAFDAIMEAGGFDESRANKKRVRIVRQDGGKIENFEIDFKKVLEGRGGEPFYLKAHDTVYVPERITWF